MSSQRIALVTGAAQGIGRAIALRLADDGFDVAVNDITSNVESLDKVVEEISAKGRATSKHIANVALEDQLREMVDEVVKQHGGLDVMVANAGILGHGLIIETSAEEWDHIMSVNARGSFLCYKYAGIQMIKQGRGGRIIGASSVAGKKGFEFQSPYCASKFAVRGLTQSAALEFGAYGITVNAYAPGAVDTPMIRKPTMPKDKAEALLAMVTEASPLKKIGIPDDIARLVSFLASEESQFITGQSVSFVGTSLIGLILNFLLRFL
ncbi:hypothetical protein B0H10DRAFT_2074116 [Mycena sp. CBHHK59/15]|nr:hypothetical protein B0H10DRAFT_2074116 [Mycena sp. CBHHK59/15]